MEKLRRLLPYLAVLLSCVIVICIYLYASHQQMSRKSYIFKRAYVNNTIINILESQKEPHNNYDYYNLELKNGVCYVSKDSTLCFAAIVKDSTKQYESGFYPYNIFSMSINKTQNITLFNLPDPYNFQQERTLAYNGFFSESNDYITYTFYYFPYVFIFDKRGKYIGQLKTKDDVPPPSIIRYKKFFVFERAKTYNSNFASFIHKNKIFVLSAQTLRNIGKYVVDCYDFKTKEYLYSFYIGNAVEEDNNYLNFLSTKEDSVTMVTDKCMTIFRINQ